MAHELDIRNDVASFAHVGEAAWHGLGQKLAEGASIDEWQTQAGMDWMIKRAVVRYATGHGQGADAWRSMDDRHVLLRSDTGEALGIVSDEYKVVQPRAVLDFFNTTAMQQGFTLDTAGVLFGGKRFWALAKIDADAVIVDPTDKVGGYLLLVTSADGTLATEARFTSVRVVCNNTLGFARGERGTQVVRVKHKTKFNANAVQRDLGIGEQFNDFILDMRRLADTAMREAETVLATAELFNPGARELARGNADDKAKFKDIVESKKVSRVLELALNNKARGAYLDGVRGTAWGWLNAVTEYVDHEARARSADNRLNSALLGAGDAVKMKAQEVALELANGTGVRYHTVPTVPASQLSDTSLLDAVLANT